MKIFMERKGIMDWKGYFPLGYELTSGKPDNKEGIWFGESSDISKCKKVKDWLMHGPNQFPAPKK